MIYKDLLYGSWELPDFIERLVHTTEMVRLRKISQVVLPNSIYPFGPMASRFQHGLGVCRLAMLVMENNPELSEYTKKLPVAGLLHDAGNPALSHLAEYFLRAMIGKDGESFLEDILKYSETEKVLIETGLDVPQILGLITGTLKPISTVLNGSMDIDNLDNVGRYAYAENLDVDFDAMLIAESFKFNGTEWTLPAYIFDEAMKWKKARATVYGNVYKEPNLVADTMIYRAVEIAYYQGKIDKNFFFLNDEQAIEYLREKCDLAVLRLVDKVTRWDWYKSAFRYETLYPSKKFADSANQKGKKELADKILNALPISEEDVCVIISKGRDVRKITVPFVFPDGSRKYDEEEERTIYRVRIYISPEITEKKTIDIIEELVRHELEII
ncbi:MAG: hypothetical protein Q7S86_01560 [bacterium]|nr:hypothetical protein [bacterium]